MISSLIRLLLSAFELALFVYCLVPLFYAPFKQTKIYTYMTRVFDPVLSVLRRLIARYLPAKYMLFDWSYVALFIIINLLQWLF